MKMPSIKGPKMKPPTMAHIARPMKIHPSAQPRIRLPQGMDNTSQAAPAPWLPGVGKI